MVSNAIILEMRGLMKHVCIYRWTNKLLTLLIHNIKHIPIKIGKKQQMERQNENREKRMYMTWMQSKMEIKDIFYWQQQETSFSWATTRKQGKAAFRMKKVANFTCKILQKDENANIDKRTEKKQLHVWKKVARNVSNVFQWSSSPGNVSRGTFQLQVNYLFNFRAPLKKHWKSKHVQKWRATFLNTSFFHRNYNSSSPFLTVRFSVSLMSRNYFNILQ